MLVTRNFPPLVGGMEGVNSRLLAELAREWRVLLCGPEGASATAAAAAAARVSEAPLKPLPAFILRNAWQAWRMARRERPGLVLAGSGLAAPMAWLAARASGARLGVYLHGLDVIAPSRVYQWLWLPFIRACDLVLVNSRNTRRLATERGVDAARIDILHPGVSLPASVDPAAAARFRAQHGLGDAPLMLSIGRFTRRKGLAEFVSNSMPLIVRAHPDACLVIIGAEAQDALHGASGQERARIESAATAAGVAGQLRFLGRCTDSELESAYQAASCHVFPVLDLPGDVEGFGMVALEAAAHGLRTAAFDVGGVSDAVDVSCSGVLVPAGNYEAMAGAVSTILGAPPSAEGRAASRAFAAGKDWQHFGARLREVIASRGLG